MIMIIIDDDDDDNDNDCNVVVMFLAARTDFGLIFDFFFFEKH